MLGQYSSSLIMVFEAKHRYRAKLQQLGHLWQQYSTNFFPHHSAPGLHMHFYRGCLDFPDCHEKTILTETPYRWLGSVVSSLLRSPSSVFVICVEGRHGLSAVSLQRGGLVPWCLRQ